MPRERLVPPPIARLNELIRVDHATFVAQTLAIERVHADFMDAVMQDAMALAAQPASAAMTATAQVERALNAESMLRVIESFWRDFPPVYNYRSAFQWALDAPRKPTLKSSSKTGETTMARPEVGTIIAYNLRPGYGIDTEYNRLFYVYDHPIGKIGCSITALSEADGYWAGDIYRNINVTPTGTRDWMTLEDAESIVTGMKSLAAKFDPANYKPNVGDKVLVVRKPTEEKANQPVWVASMDDWLHRVCRVTRVGDDRVELDHSYWFALEWLQPVGIVDPKKGLRKRACENLNALIAKWNSPYDIRRTRYKWYGESNDWGRQTAKIKAIAEKRDATEVQMAIYLNHLANQGRETAQKIEPTIFNGTDNLYRGSWQEIGFLPKKDFWRLHCLHVSTEDNSKIAYYPTLRHMREGREVRTSLGKYLTKYKDVFEYDENTIRNLAQKFTAMQTGAGYELHFKEQDDPDGWVEVYNKGPHSCMKGEDATRIYASGVSNLRLAYLTDYNGDIVARCIVRDSDDPDVKGYVRVYPDPNGEPEGRRLKDLLEEAGYGNHTNLKGCLLSFIQDGSDIVCPYLDYGNGDMSQVVERYVHEGKTYLRAGYGHIGATSTGGYTEGSDQGVCACCDEYTNDDELTEVRGGDYVCPDCLSESYVEAYARYSYTEWVHEDRAIRCETNGAYYHDDFLAYHDIYQCEYTDDYYHIDDLEMTSRGYVFVEECVELDVPDDDGNDWAVKGDTVTLADGRVVHEDMAEKDWITGEWLLADEDEDGVIQIFARQMTSSRGIAQCAYVYTTLEALADSIDDWVVEFTPRFSSGRYVQSVSCIAFKDAVEPGSAVINFRDLTYDMIRSDEAFEKIFEYLDEHGLIETLEEAA